MQVHKAIRELMPKAHPWSEPGAYGQILSPLSPRWTSVRHISCLLLKSHWLKLQPPTVEVMWLVEVIILVLAFFLVCSTFWLVCSSQKNYLQTATVPGFPILTTHKPYILLWFNVKENTLLSSLGLEIFKRLAAASQVQLIAVFILFRLLLFLFISITF